MRKKKMPNFLSVIRTKIPRHFTQVLATLAVSLGPFAAGLGKGYTSPALASLKESKSSTFPVSPQEGSWIASLSLLGAIFGCLVGGLLLQFGRKMSLLLVALPFSGSWLLTVFAQGVEMMYCSSFIAGFCSATILLATQVYVSEISHPEIRGCLSAILKMAGHLGALCSTSLGAFLDWRQLAGAAAVVPLFFFLAILAIPETPSFLLYHAREEEASKSLSWLRSRGEDVAMEIETLRSNILTKERSLFPKFSSQLTRPLFITCGLMFFHKFSGVTVFNHYAVPIFQHFFETLPLHAEVGRTETVIMVFGRSLNPHGAAIVVIFLQLLGSMTSGLLIDTAGRLPLLIVSSLFISGSFFGFGLYNWLEVSLPAKQSGFGPSLDWIPLTCVLFFTLFFSIGIGPISWLLVGELFPLEFRGFGGAVCTSFSYACAFVAVKTYEDIKSQIGLYGAFWIYSGVSILGLFFVCYAVPETKGVELEEMHHTDTATSLGQPLENHVLVSLPPPSPKPRSSPRLPQKELNNIELPINSNNNNTTTPHAVVVARNQANRNVHEPSLDSHVKNYDYIQRSSPRYHDLSAYYSPHYEDFELNRHYSRYGGEMFHSYQTPYMEDYVDYAHTHEQPHRQLYHSTFPQYDTYHHHNQWIHYWNRRDPELTSLYYHPPKRNLRGTSV